MCLILLTGCLCPAMAQYSIRAVKGKVEVKHLGKVTPAQVDMALGGADLIIIGEGSSVQILNKQDSKLYTRDIPGEVSVMTLMFDAKKAAANNRRNVGANVSTGKAAEEEGHMYVEKGKITLALEEYDPSSENFMIDAKVMGRYIVDMLNSKGVNGLRAFPTPIEHKSTPEGELMFSVTNDSDVPLYINVIKVTTGEGNRPLRISELGQPIGCYVILPDQSITRSQSKGSNPDDIHLLVATCYYFSIDELIDEITRAFGEEPSAGPVVELPIYMTKL